MGLAFDFGCICLIVFVIVGFLGCLVIVVLIIVVLGLWLVGFV